MEIQQQIDFADALQNKFLDLHNKFLHYPDYEDRHYEVLADGLEHIIQSLWQLQQLDL